MRCSNEKFTQIVPIGPPLADSEPKSCTLQNKLFPSAASCSVVNSKVTELSCNLAKLLRVCLWEYRAEPISLRRCLVLLWG